jgi:hypothetical protein
MPQSRPPNIHDRGEEPLRLLAAFRSAKPGSLENVQLFRTHIASLGTT